jgi:hypothetical protein
MIDNIVQSCDKSIPERLLKRCKGEVIVQENNKKVVWRLLIKKKILIIFFL